MGNRTRTIKVFCDKGDLDQVTSHYELVESYKGFQVIRASSAMAKKFASAYPTEDITDQYVISMPSGAVNTSRPRIDTAGKTRSHAAYKGVKRLSAGKHHYLVQFVGPIKPAWLTRIRKLGAEPRQPYSGFAYVIRSDAKTLANVTRLPFVRWVGHLSHRDRVFVGDPAKTLPRTRRLRNTYTLSFFDAKDMKKASSAVRQVGVKILSRNDSTGTMTVQLGASGQKARAQITKLSAIHGVRAIRSVALKRTSNDIAAGIMRVQQAWSAPLGLSGAGEIIAVCDTGLDTGNAATIHDDFTGRVKAMKSYPVASELSGLLNNTGADDGVADLDSGHGTHVAGSVLGSGVLSNGLPDVSGPVRGIAYDAELVFQAVEQEVEWKDPQYELENGRYILAGIPSDLKELFRYAYNRGARIHSNSWGGGEPGGYDEQCYQLDEFVWGKKDFCVVFSAGNDGTDKDGDGQINPMSVASPGTAKNCITVGASENFRREFDGATYGSFWPTDYPVAPFRDAPMANSPNQVVAFSSRGPTQDGRTKPDVVAPGTFILSTRSRKIALNNTAWAPLASSRNYFHMGGTSMATPLVAGAVGLLRQFLREWVGNDSPSAAMLKATLILAADKLSHISSSSQISDHQQGYGRVNLDSVVAPPDRQAVYFLDDRQGLRTGDLDEYSFRLTSSSSPLRIAMAYSDYPGQSLVNNLNLMLIDPNGRQYVGNVASSGSLTMDSKNNVEVIEISKPGTGTWSLRVVGSNVPRGRQEYAWALRGRVQF